MLKKILVTLIMEKITMKKMFENVVLAEFTTNSGSEPFMCFQAENGKEQKERLLKTFFNTLIVPLIPKT